MGASAVPLTKPKEAFSLSVQPSCLVVLDGWPQQGVASTLTPGADEEKDEAIVAAQGAGGCHGYRAIPDVDRIQYR